MLCGAALSVFSKIVPVIKENIGIAFPPQYTSNPLNLGHQKNPKNYIKTIPFITNIKNG